MNCQNDVRNDVVKPFVDSLVSGVLTDPAFKGSLEQLLTMIYLKAPQSFIEMEMRLMVKRYAKAMCGDYQPTGW